MIYYKQNDKFKPKNVDYKRNLQPTANHMKESFLGISDNHGILGSELESLETLQSYSG